MNGTRAIYTLAAELGISHDDAENWLACAAEQLALEEDRGVRGQATVEDCLSLARHFAEGVLAAS